MLNRFPTPGALPKLRKGLAPVNYFAMAAAAVYSACIGPKLAIIGGGAKNAFFGRMYRNACGLLNGSEIVGLVGSSDPDKCMEQAADWGDPGYRTITEMLTAIGKTVEIISIQTPHDQHLANIREIVYCLKAGHLDPNALPLIVLEKPIAHNLADATAILVLCEENGLLFVVSNTWFHGFNATALAQWCGTGALGPIHGGSVNYIQGWGPKGAPRGFRGDPKRNGYLGSGGDLLPHCTTGIENVTGELIAEICAAETRYEAKETERDFAAIGRFEHGGLVTFRTSQTAVGRLNDMSVEVWGHEARFTYTNVHPDDFTLQLSGRPDGKYSREGDYSKDPLGQFCASAQALMPSTWGHGDIQFTAGHNGRELGPGNHAAAFFTNLAAILFRGKKLRDLWVANGCQTRPDVTFELVLPECGLRQCEILAAATQSILNGGFVKIGSVAPEDDTVAVS